MRLEPRRLSYPIQVVRVSLRSRTEVVITCPETPSPSRHTIRDRDMLKFNVLSKFL